MTFSSRLTTKLGIAALALSLIGGVASAQQKAPQPAPAPKAAQPAPAAPAPGATKAPAKKGASDCRGLAQAACTANAACAWVAETKTKAGRTRRAHCRLKTAPPKRAAAPKAAPKAAAPKSAPAAPATPGKK